jgi:DNA-binding MarR family transcriptional regulator
MAIEPLQRRNDSINYRIYALASSLSKGAMRFYLAKFGLALPEMRLLSTLGSHRRLSSLEFVELTAMDKGLVSRVLNSLAKRGCVEQVLSAAGSGRRVWKLSRTGAALVARLRPVWKERESRLQADLSPQDRALLLRLLDRLFHASEKLRAEEVRTLPRAPRRRSPGRRRAPKKAA